MCPVHPPLGLQSFSSAPLPQSSTPSQRWISLRTHLPLPQPNVPVLQSAGPAARFSLYPGLRRRTLGCNMSLSGRPSLPSGLQSISSFLFLQSVQKSHRFSLGTQPPSPQSKVPAGQPALQAGNHAHHAMLRSSSMALPLPSPQDCHTSASLLGQLDDAHERGQDRKRSQARHGGARVCQRLVTEGSWVSSSCLHGGLALTGLAAGQRAGRRRVFKTAF